MDLSVKYSTIALKLNTFLLNPSARGGNLGAIYPAVKEIIGQIREECCLENHGKKDELQENEIALTVMGLIKDGILYCNSHTVTLFFKLIDMDAISKETIDSMSDIILEFLTTGYLDEENKSNNKYGKMFWCPIITMEKYLGLDNEMFKYLKSTKSLEGNLKLDEIYEMKKLHENEDEEQIIADLVEQYNIEYKEMNKLPEFKQDRTCPDCNSTDISPIKKIFIFGGRKTFKCNKCGFSW